MREPKDVLLKPKRENRSRKSRRCKARATQDFDVKTLVKKVKMSDTSMFPPSLADVKHQRFSDLKKLSMPNLPFHQRKGSQIHVSASQLIKNMDLPYELEKKQRRKFRKGHQIERKTYQY